MARVILKRLKLITIYRIREHTNHWDPPEEPLGHRYIHSGFVILNRIRSLAHIQLMQVIRYFLERIDSCTQIISLMKHPPLPPPHPTHTAINLIVFFYNYKFRRLIADLVVKWSESEREKVKVKSEVIFWSLIFFVFRYVEGGVLGNNNIGIKKCTTTFLWVLNFGQVGELPQQFSKSP